MLFLALGQILVQTLDARLGDGDASRTYELQDATEFIELVEVVEHIGCDACLLDNGVGGINLHNVGIVATYDTRHLGISEHHRRRKLQQRGFEDEDFIIDEAVGLQHVDALLDLLGKHLSHLLLAIAGNRVFMYAWCRRSAYVERLDIDLTTSKDGRNLI